MGKAINTQELPANVKVGLGQIDDHHAKVFALIDQLASDQLDDITSERFSSLYEKFFEAVKDEFKEEEKLMLESEISVTPHMEEHISEHSRLLGRIYDVLFDAMHQDRIPVTTICQMLRADMQEHIERYDMPTFQAT